MATITNVVRWADNTTALMRNLSEGLDQIEATTSAADKMAKTLGGDNLIRAANNYAAAVDKIGGVTKLTTAEKDRLHATLTKAIDKYAVLGREAPAALRDLAAQTQRVEEKTGFLDRTLGPLKNTILATFSVAAVTGAVKAYADFAGTIVDLSAKTGISEEGIQRLQMAFAESGVSIDTVTNAIGEMGKRLVEADKTASNALTQLNLDAKELIGLAPDQAFLRVADALGQIENPMERVTLAQAIFGKQGRELLAGLHGDLSETIAQYERLGLVISADALQAADAFGDQMGVLKTTGMAFLSQVIGPMMPGLTEMARLLGGVGAIIPWLRDGFNDLIAVGIKYNIWLFDMATAAAEVAAKIPSLRNAMGHGAEDVAYFREQAQLARDMLQSFQTTGVEPVQQAMRAATPVIGTYGDAMKTLVDTEADLIESQVRAQKWLEQSKKHQQEQADAAHAVNLLLVKGTHTWADYATLTEKATARVGQAIVQEVKDVEARQEAYRKYYNWIGERQMEDDARNRASSRTWAGLTDSVQNLGTTILGAAQGGGSIIKSVGASLGKGLGDDLVENFGKNITGALGKTLGGAINAVIPGVGALLGPLMGKVGGWFKGVFGIGVNDEVKKYNAEIEKLRQGLLSTYGPLSTLETQARALGLSFEAAWGHQNKAGLEAFKGLIAEFEKKLADARAEHAALTDELKTLRSDSEITWEKMRDAAGRYGVRLSELGKDFQNGRLHESFQTIWDDYQLLIRGGADVGGVLFDMKDEIIALAMESVQFGTTIPKNFEPLLRNLEEGGHLIGENGERLLDLSKVQFGDPIVAKLDVIADRILVVVDRIEALAEALTGRLRGAIDSIPTSIDIDVNGRYHPPDIPSFEGRSVDLNEGFARGTVAGGSWFRDFGRGTPTVLHGREAVVRPDQAVQFAREHGGGSDPVVRQQLGEMIRLLKKQGRELGYGLAEAMMRKGAA